MVDALRGPNVHKSSEWAAWHGTEVSFVIDMGKTDPYGSVAVGCLSNKPSHIFLPQSISVAVSEDGENYTEVARQDYGVEGKDAPDTVVDRTLEFPAASARYVKVTVTPVEAMPDWHYAPGKRTFVFIDEVIVK